MKSKTTFETKAFKKALAAVLPAVSRTSPLHALTHVRVRFASLMGSDTQMQITAPVDATGDVLDICLPSDKLRAAVDVAGPQIKISLDGPKAVIEAGRARFTTPYLDGSDFPVMDEGEADAEFTSTAEMHAAIERVAAFASDPADVRPYFTGVFIENGPEGATATACDGSMLGSVGLDIQSKPFSLIVRTAAVQIIAKAAPGRWAVSRRLIVIESDDCRTVIACIDANYPYWRRLLSETNCSVTFNRAEMGEAAQLSRLVVDKKVQPMRVTAEGDVLNIVCPNKSEQIETHVGILDQKGDPLRADLNGKLLAAMIKATADETLTFAWCRENLPNAALQMNTSDGLTALVMPMRL